jgi:hypothetical protein
LRPQPFAFREILAGAVRLLLVLTVYPP